jgi:hypothetical protein
MRKKLIISFIFALPLAGISWGEVIGNWEQTMDGWAIGEGVTANYSATGGTNGNWSLKLNCGDKDVLGRIILSGEQIDKVLDGTYDMFSLEVTRFATDWRPIPLWLGPLESRVLFSLGFSGFDESGLQYTYGTGVEILGAEWYPSSIPAGHLPPGMTEPDPDGTMTAAWSLDNQRAAIQCSIDAGYIYDIVMDITLLADVRGYQEPVVYYIDNAQLIPEPATMAFFGLGLLMLGRKS